MSNTYRRIVRASRLAERYRAMWSIAGEHRSHALTGGLNDYRASSLHPAAEADPAIGVEADLQRWVMRVPVRVIWA
jgi:hypothetical protein